MLHQFSFLSRGMQMTSLNSILKKLFKLAGFITTAVSAPLLLPPIAITSFFVLTYSARSLINSFGIYICLRYSTKIFQIFMSQRILRIRFDAQTSPSVRD